MNGIKIILILISTLLSALSFAQMSSGFYKTDVGIKVGAANYLGEIGGKEKDRRNFIWDMKIPQTRTSFSVFGRHRFLDYVAGSVGINYNRIKGDDNLSTNVGRVGRNLRFRNDIIDLTLRAEGYFYKISDVGNKGRYYASFETYGHFGATAFMSNPKGSLDGSSWKPLRPLKTEGVDYKKFGIGIPVGLGFYFTYKRKHRIGWDITWVTTFTDYLDDISDVYATPTDMATPEASDYANQSEGVEGSHLPSYLPGEKRGDPTHNDSYMYTTLSYSYVLKGRYKGFASSSKRGRRRKRKVVRKERVKL